ncbi:MAG: hypothetical protein IJC99_01370 [Clostridia bacterium]|nr:hypothetical protein [Clostridia bacterium]
MHQFSGYEFAVSQRKEGKWIAARIGLIMIYAIYVLTVLLLGLKLRLIVPLLAFIPLTVWLLIFITWRYVQVDYEYSIVSGTLTFTKIYGNRQRKRVFEMQLKDAVRIAPLASEQEAARGAAYAPEREFIGVSSMSAPDIYFMLFELDDRRNREKRRAIFYFEATAKALAICRFYNPSGTVMSDVSR